MYIQIDQKRGTLNGTQTAITSGTFEQQWGLDATGNWKTFNVPRHSVAGNLSVKSSFDSPQDSSRSRKSRHGVSSHIVGTWELNQTRTTNKANEITGITNSVGAAWATPTYDPAGNMAGIPNPQSLTAEYDAWNRLVTIKDGATMVSQHVYDARGYRIRKDTYTSGTLTEARHYYYTPGWQCVEERIGTSTNAERQFVWRLRYIDDLILRDRSTANNGTMDERRYAMQDGNWNTIAICDTSGSVGERYAYSAYGTPVFMTGAGVVQSTSTVGFETLYAGYRFDGTTPQMYYVRNRFLLPMIGTWNRKDPLGYVDGMNLNTYLSLSPTSDSDPYGEQESVIRNAIGTVQRLIETEKGLPAACKQRIQNLPKGVCPILIFAGHFVDPDPKLKHGGLVIMDELYGWYNEFETEKERSLPPDWYIVGTDCSDDRLTEHRVRSTGINCRC